MEEQFVYLLRASAGWTQVRLSLSDESAQIDYDAASMGVDPNRFTLHCKHKKLSDTHGILITTSCWK